MRRWYPPATATTLLLGALVSVHARCESMPPPQLEGFNVIQSSGHPFGCAAAKLALANAKRAGANTVAVVPFLWQANPQSPDLVRGKDMSDDELRAAIRDAHTLGLSVLVKPHVWVPQGWAGAVAMTSEADWRRWFANYGIEIGRIARIAEDEKAEALAVGTELAGTSQRPEWNDVIREVRALYSGRLLYVAHNIEEAEKVPFWDRLDSIGVTLYPPLGADSDRAGRRAAMRTIADRLDALSARAGKSVIVGEIGMRSAQGAAAKPWESPAQHPGVPDSKLQADVLVDWLSSLDRPAIRGVLIWDWLSDPDAGGVSDTDFTVQGKPAEQILKCAWTKECNRGAAGASGATTRDTTL
jgi:hypothetical protein